MIRRVFLIVLDSFGVGEMPDAAAFGDEGSSTIHAVSTDPELYLPNMNRLGLLDLDEVWVEPASWMVKGEQKGCALRLKELSAGKDTTIGHWEIAGLVSPKAMPTFPDGFPTELLEKLCERTGRDILCNRPYSGTKVIHDYGQEHMETGALIVYTSADSVLQIAAHEDVVPVEELYRYCEIARELCQGDLGVGRIIARPFTGSYPNFERTTRRHDFSLLPPRSTMLDAIKDTQREVFAIGKINDIFAGKGVTGMVRTQSNEEGIERTLEKMKDDFEGLCFTNLVDFDMKYGHRNDVHGYAMALNAFDAKLPELMAGLREEDMLIITADHGCDPSTESTDHSREYIPCLIYGKQIADGKQLGTRDGFCTISATILEALGVQEQLDGNSVWNEIKK